PDVAAELAPRFRWQRTAADTADPEVEADVRLDQRVDASRLLGVATLSDQLPSLRRIARRATLGGEARRQRVESLAQFVDGEEEFPFQRGDDQAAAAGVAHEALRLEDGQRLSDRLPRDPHPRGEIVLVQP